MIKRNKITDDDDDDGASGNYSIKTAITLFVAKMNTEAAEKSR